MNHQTEQKGAELIELGAVSVETKGIPGGSLDTQGGQVLGGISDD